MSNYLNDLKELVLKQYNPKTTSFQIYQDKSLYCDFKYSYALPEILAVSLNIPEKRVYVYLRSKNNIPHIKEIIPHISLFSKNNVFYYEIGNLNKEELTTFFALLIKFVDGYFLEIINRMHGGNINNTLKGNIQSKKRIYTFWHSVGATPAYLSLCMETWKKNIPNLEIIIINHTNWAQYVGHIYNLEKLKTFSLPMQSDAISAAILAEYGGIFIDMDTIITQDIFKIFVPLEPSKLVCFGQPDKKYMHVAVLKCLVAGNPLLQHWVNTCKERIDNKAEKFDWSYMGNGILYPACNNPKYFKDYLILDRAESGNILEAALLKEGNVEADYYNCFFNPIVNISTDLAIKAAKYGLISLHNSWTPTEYKSYTSIEQVFTNPCLLSRLLKNILKRK